MVRRRGYAPTRDAKTSLDRLSPAITALQKEAEVTKSFKIKEQDTGQTWIDGKIIYRTVLDVGPLPNAMSKSIEHNLDFSNVIRIYGGATDGEEHISLPYPSPTAGAPIQVFLNSSNVVIITGSDRTSYEWAYVIAEYTR